MAFGLDLGNLLVHLRADSTQFNRTLLSAEKRLRATADKLNSMGRTMTMRVTLPLVGIAAAATKSFASFDDAMTKSLAIMKDVTPGLRKEMEKVAIDISKKSIVSATQLAKSYFYLASAGLSAQQSIAALGAVEKFAVAGAFDMALATDLATDAQSALGLTVKDSQKNLENMTRVTDVLIGANTLANASAQQFSEALMRAGPAMKAFGIEIEEGTAVLAAYADQGKKAAVGGELFSRMLRLMIKGFIDNREAWDRFGISIDLASGKLRPMADIVRDLTGLLDGMGVIQKAATLQMLGFQARSQQAIMPLLGLGDEVERYNKLLIEMSKVTRETAEKQLRSFSSQMKILWHNIVDVARDMGSILAPHILNLNSYILRATEYWHSLNDSVKQSILLYGAVAAAIGPMLIATGLLLKSLAFMVATVKSLTVAFTGLTIIVVSPIAAILALAAIVYVLRAAWVQSLDVIKDRLQYMLNAFVEGFDWLLSGPVANTIKTFAKAWIDLFYFIGTNFDDFVSDMAGTMAGLKTWLQKLEAGVVGVWDAWSLKQAIAEWKSAWKDAGEDFSSSFVKSKEKAEKAFNDFNESVTLGYKTTALTLRAYGEATIEHLGELMNAVKKQFGKDADAIIGLIKEKMRQLRKEIPLIDVLSAVDVGPILREWENSLKPSVELTEKMTESLVEEENMIKRMLAELDTEYSLLGKMNEERKRAIRLEKFREELVRVHKNDLEKINELMTQYIEKLEKIAEGLRGWSAFTVQIKQWHRDATNLWENLGKVTTDALDRTADALTDMCLRGKADFKALARSIVADLTRMIIKYKMAQALGMIFPSLTASMFNAPTPVNAVTPEASAMFTRYQHGGIAWEPQVAMVAEKEPELITPLSQLKSKIGGDKRIIEVNIDYKGQERHEVGVEESIGALKEQVLTITMDAMQHSMKYRKSIKQASR